MGNIDTSLTIKSTPFSTCQYVFQQVKFRKTLRRASLVEGGTNSLTRTVGRAIHLRRKILGISQEVLAERVGIGQQSLSRMEQGKIAPKFERLQIIADALGCRVTDLFINAETAEDSYTRYLTDIMSPLSVEERAFVVEQAARLARFLAYEKGPQGMKP